MTTISRRWTSICLVLALASTDAVTALAQNDVIRAPADNPLRTISRTLKMSHEPAPPPDWVLKTRKPEGEVNYIPTGAAARKEPAPAMSVERLKEIERTLDAERARHDQLGRRTPAPKAQRTVAIGPMAKKKAAPRKCALTCTISVGGQKKR